MDIYTCLDASNELWLDDDMPGAGEYRIRNQVSGKCLTVRGAGISNGSKLPQYECNTSGSNVWWQIVP
jgi:hypothetical protein